MPDIQQLLSDASGGGGGAGGGGASGLLGYAGAALVGRKNTVTAALRSAEAYSKKIADDLLKGVKAPFDASVAAITQASSPGDLIRSNLSKSVEGGAATATTAQDADTGAAVASSSDMRVRIAPLDMATFGLSESSTSVAPQNNQGSTTAAGGQSAPASGGGILAPLKATGGLLFPYTPTISFSQDVDYPSMSMVHSNQDYYSFSRMANPTIQVTGRFTVQNQTEGRYLMAAIHFLRSVSRMHFGAGDAHAGAPPTRCSISGYGPYVMNRTKCIVRSHSYTFEENVDMVNVSVNGATVMLPVIITLTVNLIVQQTPKIYKDQFTLEKYISGELLQTGGWF